MTDEPLRTLKRWFSQQHGNEKSSTSTDKQVGNHSQHRQHPAISSLDAQANAFSSG